MQEITFFRCLEVLGSLTSDLIFSPHTKYISVFCLVAKHTALVKTAAFQGLFWMGIGNEMSEPGFCSSNWNLQADHSVVTHVATSFLTKTCASLLMTQEGSWTCISNRLGRGQKLF